MFRVNHDFLSLSSVSDTVPYGRWRQPTSRRRKQHTFPCLHGEVGQTKKTANFALVLVEEIIELINLLSYVFFIVTQKLVWQSAPDDHDIPRSRDKVSSWTSLVMKSNFCVLISQPLLTRNPPCQGSRIFVPSTILTTLLDDVRRYEIRNNPRLPFCRIEFASVLSTCWCCKEIKWSWWYANVCAYVLCARVHTKFQLLEVNELSNLWPMRDSCFPISVIIFRQFSNTNFLMYMSVSQCTSVIQVLRYPRYPRVSIPSTMNMSSEILINFLKVGVAL